MMEGEARGIEKGEARGIKKGEAIGVKKGENKLGCVSKFKIMQKA